MSKNIVIQEGGTSKQLTVDKLKTGIVGGGTCLWVPEGATTLGTKSIDEDGTYRASDDGYYGYSEVTVSGVGSVTGKYPDGSGDDAGATVDPSTGEIVITKLPSSIRVVTPPSNPSGVYTDGQTITIDGMVVKGYLASGGEWGTVPNGEITINPTVATYDASTDIDGKEISDSSLTHPSYFSQPIAITGGSVQSGVYGPDNVGDQFVIIYSAINADYLVILQYDSVYYFLAIGESPSTKLHIESYRRKDNPPDTSEYESWSTEDKTPATYTTNISQKTVYVANEYRLTTWAINGPSNTISGYDINDLVTILYDGESIPSGSRQQIDVSWPRPQDYQMLSDAFTIVVEKP